MQPTLETDHRRIRRFGRLSKTRTAVLFVFAIALSVSLGQLVLANYYATKGDDLSVLLQKKEALREENDTLRQELAQKTSLLELAKQARDRGFTATNTKATVFVQPLANTKPVALESSTNVIR